MMVVSADVRAKKILCNILFESKDVQENNISYACIAV